MKLFFRGSLYALAALFLFSGCNPRPSPSASSNDKSALSSAISSQASTTTSGNDKLAPSFFYSIRKDI